jgi:O-antigen/teichoic acid export membrane protein
VVTGEELPVEAGVPDPMESLGLRRILRSASGLSGASLFGSALAVGAGLLTAHWLGPTRYGNGQFVLLIYLYATLMRSGVFEGSVRSFVDHLARGEEAEARGIQNVGVSFEVVASAIPGIAIAIVGLFLAPGVIQFGLFLAPVAVVASSGGTFLSTLWSARRRFDVVGKVAFMQAFLGPVLLVGFVAALGTPGIFLAPAVTSVVTTALYFAFRPPLGLRPSFDVAQAKPLLRVGFPLGVMAEIYWAYRLVGTTSVAIATNAATLGLYSLAAAPIAVATSAIAGIQTVLLPTIWRELSLGAAGPLWARHAERITVALGVIAGATAGMGQAAFAPLAMAFLPSFAPSIRLFDILALTILLLPAATVASLTLDSKRANRQKRHLAIWSAALAVNIVANVVVLRMGWGAQAVAINDVWIQFVVAIVIFETASGYIWGDQRRQRFGLYARMAFVIAVAVGVTTVLDHGVADLRPGRLDIAALLIRCVATGAAWAIVAVLLLRTRAPVTTPTD